MWSRNPSTGGAPARVPGTAHPGRVMSAPPTVNIMMCKVTQGACKVLPSSLSVTNCDAIKLKTQICADKKSSNKEGSLEYDRILQLTFFLLVNIIIYLYIGSVS